MTGYGYGDGYSDGDGDGIGYGYGDGDGYGYGYGYGNGAGAGAGDGDGYGDGDGVGAGYGDGDGEQIGEVGNYPVMRLPTGYVRVGCEVHSRTWWRKHWSELARQHDIVIDASQIEALLGR